MANTNYLHSQLTEEIIKAYYHVFNNLGYGFLEKVYENALKNTLQKRGHKVEQQVEILVHFESEIIGEYVADLIVNDLVIVELKSVEQLNPKHEAQLVNYLKATTIEVGLLLNFGEQPSFKRRVFTNNLKQIADKIDK